MASSSNKNPADLDFDPLAVRGFVPPRTEDETRLMRRIEELCSLAVRRGVPRYTGFLSDREQALAQAAANRAGCTFARFWGGWQDAERKVLCLEPPDAWQEEPVAALRVRLLSPSDRPAHRDLLGAVLGLGLDRAAVGDVLMPPQSGGEAAYLFALADKAEFIAANLTSAGRSPVRAELCAALPPEILQPAERTLHQATVPALRADAVLAAMMHISRAQAAQFITAGRVQVNHLPLRAAHERVFAKDIFTVSGVGRYRLQEIGGKSRKDRIFIIYYQY